MLALRADDFLLYLRAVSLWCAFIHSSGVQKRTRGG
jgi:hypothetical protein